MRRFRENPPRERGNPMSELQLQEKKEPHYPCLPPVGMRLIKTCISCLLVSLVYMYLLPERNPCFACIGAAYAMGSHIHEGFKHGFNRFVGTLLGGLMVIPFYWLYYNRPLGIPSSIFMVVGLFCVIYINLVFGANNAVQPATVVYFVVLYTQAPEVYVSYTIARIIDTGIGAAFSIGINMLTPSAIDKMQGLQLNKFLHHWRRSNQRSEAEKYPKKPKN